MTDSTLADSQKTSSMADDVSSHLLPVYARQEVAFARGEGAWLISETGERYLDFASGVGVNCLGHSHPHLIQALRDQLDRPLHVSNLYRIPEQEDLARRLCEASFADLAFFCNSGAEAVECAIKMARAFHHGQGRARHEILGFSGAFHGRTLAALAAAGEDGDFPPRLGGFRQTPFGDLDAARRATSERTAAILAEPVQGDGGVHAASSAFLRGLRALADDHGALLLFDEVQCGMGRTGRLFAHEDSGVVPDCMAIAKGLGGGVPIGCCLATRHAAQFMRVRTHGSTFGGNPMAMRAAHAVLDCLLAPDFLSHIRGMGLRMAQKMAMLCGEYPDILSGFRAEGLMIGLVGRAPVAALQEAAFQERLLTAPAAGNVLRLLPPLIISEEEAGEATTRLLKSCQRLRENREEKRR